MSTDKAFEGDFLFVNHNAGQMKASVHRRKVFSHVQNKYRNWKRQEDNRALKASIKTSLAESRRPSGVEVADATRHFAGAEHARSGPERDLQATSAQSLRGEQRSGRITIRSLITEDDPGSAERAIVDARTQMLLARLHTPDSVLREGNSDPFDAYAVKIDPAANELLAFYRDTVLPALYHTTKHKWITISSARRDWQDCIHGWAGSNGLGDEGAGTAFIATCATVAAMVSRNPTIQDQANRYRSKSAAILRDRLAAGPGDHRQIYWHINLILGAETYSGNRVGTAAHLTMLRQFFERQKDRLDPDLLLYVVFHDIHISSMFLCRPVFDMDRWLPARFQPLIDAAKPHLPDLSEVRGRFLDPSIDNPRLRTLFIERRESLAVWLAQRGSDDESEHSSALLGWLQVRVYLHQGRLVNFFLHAEAQYKGGLPPELMNSLACQGYLSLATLLYIRSISFNAEVHGMRLFDATKTILVNMQEMLVCSERPEFPNYGKYENARLWALYVGASAELFMGMRPERRGWFTVHLAKKAVQLGLEGGNAWDKVTSVLKGFLYNDLMHPDGEKWFKKVLETAKESESDLGSAEK
ncbi:hypothetical protein PV04_02299 [Phialophora macrospora]|uniref:Transcription factor domain-containing protein n=1 Tax=Phialophora macrospora TaxID=1851006 RepID=A0A0D2E6R0_9EURO|nr:hypothetical protein PV04_02299 [Phialophora macrospora]